MRESSRAVYMFGGQAVQPPTRDALSFRRRVTLTLALVAWAVVTLAAFGWLLAYDSTPGAQRSAPAVTQPTSDRYSLFVFLHPECPCSRATLSELARLTARVERPVDVRVLFVVSQDAADDAWRQTSLYASAAAIPGVSVSADPGGLLARKYSAATSGQAVLYAPDGRLAFAGGITASRSHEGDNAGSSAILAILAGRPAETGRTPVFGCALFDDADDDINAPRNGKVSD